jgi:hypothetical protein
MTTSIKWDRKTWRICITTMVKWDVAGTISLGLQECITQAIAAADADHLPSLCRVEVSLTQEQFEYIMELADYLIRGPI